MENVVFDISEDVGLDLPKNLFYYKTNEALLIISPEQANWIVLFNEKQINVFNALLKQRTIRYLFKKFNEEDINFVLGQIIDREFLDKKIKFSNNQDSLYIYLTNNCNLKCKHCYMYSGKPKINELEKEEWFKIIENAAKNGIKHITFTGGEVLTYKYWYEVLSFAKKSNITVTVLTNGVLWSKKDIEKCKNIIDEVQISLDGVDEESNSIIRGKGNFKKTLETVKQFVKAGIKTSISTTPTMDNFFYIEKKYVNFAKSLLNELKSENLYFKIAQKLIPGREIDINEYEKNKKTYNEITGKLANELYPNYSLLNFIKNTTPNVGLRNCGYGGLSISSDGKFFLCNRVEELEYIATKEEDFKEILKKAKFYETITSVDYVIPCKSCEIRYICGGGCRIDEFNFKGNHKLLNDEFCIIKKECSLEYKEKLYKKMIDSIRYMYC